MIRTKLYLIPLLCFLLFSISCATNKQPVDNSDKLNSINIIDRNGISETISNAERLKKFENIDFDAPQPYQKVLRIYGCDPFGNTTSYITSYHPNGQLKQYLESVNNRAFGIYREHYIDGKPKVEATVIGGVADLNTGAENTWLYDQTSRAWDEKGNLSAEIQYSKGELEGISLYYHPCGKIWKKLPYHNSKLNGTMEVFVEDGQLLQTTEYVNGEKTGLSIRYWNASNRASEEMYQQGLLVTGKYYTLSGELVCEVIEGEGYRAVFGKDTVYELQEYHEGVVEGEIKTFDKNSRLTRIYHKKNDRKHGEYVEYWDKKIHALKPQVRLSIMYYEGKIQGLVRTWYENGVQESQREMSNNGKNGLATAWYRDGSLMLIEDYDHDKIIRGEYYKKGEKIPVSQIIQGNGIATLFDGEGHFIRKINYHNHKSQE